MNIYKAVLMTNMDFFHDVYDDETLANIQEYIDVFPTIISHDNLEKYRDILKEADFIFSTWGFLGYTAEEIDEYFPNLKVVFYAAGSVKRFAKPFLDKGIKVFSSWAANGVAVAQFTSGQILLANKGYFQAVLRGENRDWLDRKKYVITHPGNYKSKVAILGAGMIGRQVMSTLAHCDIEFLVYDPYVSDDVLKEYGATRVDLDTAFSEAQIISCHISNIPSTVGMLTYEYFSKMKPNGIFINTGRGAQVIEADLIRAMEEFPTRTALLDVTCPEPPDFDGKLANLPNIFITPHISGSTANERARMGKYMYEESKRFVSGEATRYEVTLDMLETMA